VAWRFERDGPAARMRTYAQAFVTEHLARRRSGTAVIHVQVGAAQRAGGDPDHHIVILLGPGIWHILDSHLAG
jgi:hypothetical protein